MFLFLLQFLMNNLDKLIGKGLDNAIIMQVIVLSLSWMIVLAIPMGVLFSTLMAFGSMSGAHETTIIKSGGRSLWRMMMPIIIIGCGLFYGVYWFNDTILPESNHRFKILMQDIQRKKPTFAIESGRFISQLEGYTILARKVDTVSGAMYGVTIYDNGFSTRTNVLSADTGSIKFSSDYARVIVTLLNGEVHQLQKQKRTDFRIAARDFLFQQSDVNPGSRGDREMSIADMRAIVHETDASINVTQKRIDTLMRDHYAEVMLAHIAGDSTGLEDIPQKTSKTDSIDIQKRVMNRLSMLRSPLESDLFQASEQQKKKKAYLVEIYKKYSIPCACLVFVFIGCPLGMMSKRGNFGISAAISLIFYVIFWACLIGGEKLADRDLISAEVGGWFGIYVTGFIGLALTFIMNNELSIKDIWLRFKR
jgi:lipopolysaccharide export system permease protein